MTNAEKYKEVFGFEPNFCGCPTRKCENCPLHDNEICTGFDINRDFWSKEYKGGNK